jgi:hypothetical protein
LFTSVLTHSRLMVIELLCFVEFLSIFETFFTRWFRTFVISIGFIFQPCIIFQPTSLISSVILSLRLRSKISKIFVFLCCFVCFFVRNNFLFLTLKPCVIFQPTMQSRCIVNSCFIICKIC